LEERSLTMLSHKYNLLKALYHAFMDDLETIDCFFEYHEIKLLHRKTQKPKTDLLDDEELAVTCDENVIHIDYENQRDSLGVVGEKSGVNMTLFETNRVEEVSEFDEQLFVCLFKVIKRLLTSAYKIGRFFFVVSTRKGYIYFFMEITMQKSVADIQLVNVPV
ncbi:hypothetical protein Tco_1208353, partial [Tanacetum coccineum]